MLPGPTSRRLAARGGGLRRVWWRRRSSSSPTSSSQDIVLIGALIARPLRRRDRREPRRCRRTRRPRRRALARARRGERHLPQSDHVVRTVIVLGGASCGRARSRRRTTTREARTGPARSGGATRNGSGSRSTRARWERGAGTCAPDGVEWDEQLEALFGLPPGTFDGSFDDVRVAVPSRRSTHARWPRCATGMDATRRGASTIASCGPTASCTGSKVAANRCTTTRGRDRRRDRRDDQRRHAQRAEAARTKLDGRARGAGGTFDASAASIQRRTLALRRGDGRRGRAT